MTDSFNRESIRRNRVPGSAWLLEAAGNLLGQRAWICVFAFSFCLAMASLTGCSLALQDGQPGGSPMNLDGSGGSCLDRALPVMEQFFQAQANPNEVTASVDCARDALVLFRSHVRGATTDTYRAVELRAFIQKFFLRRHSISDGLMIEVMRLKQALLGGSTETITREELEQADRLLAAFRDESLKLLQHMKILSMEAEKESFHHDPAPVEAAIQQLERSAVVLGELLGRSKAAYERAHAENLLREFGALYDASSDWKGPEILGSYFPTISALKAFFIRPGGDVIAPGEWPELVAGSAKIYGIYLRHYYLIDGRWMNQSGGLEQLIRLGEDVSRIIEDAIAAKPDGVIRFEQIDAMLEANERHHVIDLGMSLPVSKHLARVAWTKGWNPSVRGRRQPAEGMTKESLVLMRQDFFGWAEVQGAWEKLARIDEVVPMKELRRRWAALAPRLRHQDSAQDISHLLGRQYPLAYHPVGTVYYKRNVENLPVDFESWTSLNWKRLFIKGGVRAFSDDYQQNRWTGLTKPQFKELYEAMRSYGLELLFLDPLKENIWDSTFDEANIFIFSGNADDRLSYAEGVEVISFALSGSQMSKRVYRDMRATCKNLGPDVFNLPMVDVSCYRKNLREKFTTYYELLPAWAEIGEKKARSDSDWDEFRKNIERAARRHGLTDRPMESADIDKMSMVFQYIESLFVRYDIDNSGTLSVAESRKAFKVLRDKLSELSGFQDDRRLLAVFTYVVRFGKKPDIDYFNMGRFLAWENATWYWSFEADRADVLKVIANLVEN